MFLNPFTVVDKVERFKPQAVLTGYNRPGQYSRSGQYWSIEKLSGQLSILAVIWKKGMSFRFSLRWK